MLQKPIYPSHDGLYHIARIKEFNSALNAGQFPPRLAPTILNSIGYPLFVANYQLPYYFAQIILIAINDPTFSFKIVMSVSFLLSGIFSFFLFKKISDPQEALLGSIIFCYLPYRFANLYTRGALGEAVSLMFVPLIFLSYHQMEKEEKIGYFLLPLSVFGLITSHTVIFLVFLPLIVTYPLFFQILKIHKLKAIFALLLLGIILSSFQIIPAIFEKKYLLFDQNLANLYRNHFISPFQLFRIPKEGINIGTPIQIGITSLLILAFSLFSFIKKKNAKIGYFILFFLISLFLTTSYSKLIWQNLPQITYILYPWRFLSLAIFSISFLAILCIKNSRFKSLIIIALVFLTIATSRHYFLKPTQMESNYPFPNLKTQNEFNTIWTNEETFKVRPLISSTDTNSKIKMLKANPFDVIFENTSGDESQITIRKMYFPGWKLQVDGKNTDIQIVDGLISTNLDPGTHLIEAKFEESDVRKFANYLTLLSFIFLLVLFIKMKPLTK